MTLELKQDWRLFQKHFRFLGRNFFGKKKKAPVWEDLLSLPSAIEQEEWLQKQLSIVGGRSFLLHALSSWTNLAAPRKKGFFFCWDGRLAQSLLLVFHGKELKGFWSPDFSEAAFHASTPSDVILQWVIKKEDLPLFGFFMTSDFWEAWHQSAQPWKFFWKNWRKNKQQNLQGAWWGWVFLLLSRLREMGGWSRQKGVGWVTFLWIALLFKGSVFGAEVTSSSLTPALEASPAALFGESVSPSLSQKDPDWGSVQDAWVQRFREALLFDDVGLSEEAYLRWVTLLEHFPDYPLVGSVHFLMIRHFFKKKAWPEVTKQAQRFLSSYPTSSDVPDVLAWLRDSLNHQGEVATAEHCDFLLQRFFPGAPLLRQNQVEKKKN